MHYGTVFLQTPKRPRSPGVDTLNLPGKSQKSFKTSTPPRWVSRTVTATIRVYTGHTIWHREELFNNDIGHILAIQKPYQ